MTPATCAPPDPNPKRPKSRIPPSACDCHFHIFEGPSEQDPARSYSASDAPLSAYRHLQDTLGLVRAVIVQPSVYGADNRTTLEFALDPRTTRAVVVVDGTAPPNVLREMSTRNAVGARVNLMFSSGAKVDDLGGFASRLADEGWHLQVLADVSDFQDLAALINPLPVPVVFDHMGHVAATKGVDDPSFQALLRLLATGNVWVKLSGAYRVAPDDYNQAGVMARALIAENPDRLVWGTDWPHPAIAGPMPNDGDLLDLLFDWADPAVVQKILVTNPEALYGFPKWEGQG